MTSANITFASLHAISACYRSTVERANYMGALYRIDTLCSVIRISVMILFRMTFIVAPFVIRLLVFTVALANILRAEKGFYVFANN